MIGNDSGDSSRLLKSAGRLLDVVIDLAPLGLLQLGVEVPQGGLPQHSGGEAVDLTQQVLRLVSLQISSLILNERKLEQKTILERDFRRKTEKKFLQLICFKDQRCLKETF